MWRSYNLNDDRYSAAESVAGLDVDVRTPISAPEMDAFPFSRNESIHETERCEWMVRLPPGFVSC